MAENLVNFKPGNSLGGRPKGSKNLGGKHTDILKFLADLPDAMADKCGMGGIAEIANGDMKCCACRGDLECRYPARDENGALVRDASGALVLHVRICESCFGSGWEKLNPKLILDARVWFGDKTVPTLKQVDHVSSDDSTRPSWNVVVVKAPEIRDGSASNQVLQAKKEEFGD